MTTRAYDFYNRFDPLRWGREEMPEAGVVTEEWLARFPPRPGGIVLELGCGTGPLSGISGTYVGTDLSLTSLVLARPFRKLAADMEQLPVKAESIAFLLSWAAIEHVPHPERVLAEIERILEPGGVALLAPAWHCRPWAAEGLDFRGYAELSGTQKLSKASLVVRDTVFWRALFEVPRRIAREVRALSGAAMPFAYSRLEPNLEEYVGTDCDAFTSMDPHAAIVYFESRGWEVLSHPGMKRRMFARHEPVVVRKRASGSSSLAAPRSAST